MTSRNSVAGLLAIVLTFGACFAASAPNRPGTPDHPRTRAPAPSQPAPPARYPPPGHAVHSLPHDHRALRVGPDRYWYHGGVFYQTHPDRTYVVVRAPIAARIRRLPPRYVWFHIGPRSYVYGNFTYYLWDGDTDEYMVVEEPPGAESAVVAASEAGLGQMFVYPTAGQSEEQQQRDRYDCHVWAVEQTGYDPSAPAPAPAAEGAGNYRRAISACLEGRGYTVK